MLIMLLLSYKNGRGMITMKTNKLCSVLFSLPVSLLLVGALKQYSQILSKINKSDEEAAVGSLGILRQLIAMQYYMYNLTVPPKGWELMNSQI